MTFYIRVNEEQEHLQEEDIFVGQEDDEEPKNKYYQEMLYKT